MLFPLACPPQSIAAGSECMDTISLYMLPCCRVRMGFDSFRSLMYSKFVKSMRNVFLWDLIHVEAQCIASMLRV